MLVFCSSAVMFAQEENGATQTQPAVKNDNLRVKLFFDSRNTEAVSFVNKVGQKSNQKFQEKVEIYLIDVSKDETAAKEVNKMLEEIFKDKNIEDFNTDVVCLFEDGTYIVGSENIESLFQPIVLSKLYPDLVKAIAEGSRNSAATDDGLMKSKNYQGAASLDGKPSSSATQPKTKQKIDDADENLKKFQLLLNILIGIVSIIIGFFLGFLVSKLSRKNTVQQPAQTE